MMHGPVVRDTVWYVCNYLNTQYVYANTRCTDVAKRGYS
jgi:hypothetical protein